MSPLHPLTWSFWASHGYRYTTLMAGQRTDSMVPLSEPLPCGSSDLALFNHICEEPSKPCFLQPFQGITTIFWKYLARNGPLHSYLSDHRTAILRTKSLLQNAFWWSFLSQDVEDYVKACQTCAQSKSSHQIPAGLLHPLPIPQCPWSHLSVDFITDLPNSNWFTTILVAIGRFSKACCIIYLKGLPTTMETSKELFNQVFRIQGLPEVILSNPIHLWGLESLLSSTGY